LQPAAWQFAMLPTSVRTFKCIVMLTHPWHMHLVTPISRFKKQKNEKIGFKKLFSLVSNSTFLDPPWYVQFSCGILNMSKFVSSIQACDVTMT
jgi:hypothetical protein